MQYDQITTKSEPQMKMLQFGLICSKITPFIKQLKRNWFQISVLSAVAHFMPGQVF